MQDDSSVPVPWQLFTFFGAFAFINLAMVLYIFHLGNLIVGHHVPQVDAVMAAKYQAAEAHLWLEEFLKGDVKESPKNILPRMHKVSAYLKGLIEGGSTPIGDFHSADLPDLKKTLRDTQEKFSQLKDLLNKRLVEKESAGIGTDLEQKFDLMFRDFIQEIDKVKNLLLVAIEEDISSFRRIQGIAFIISFLLFFIAGVLFFQYERNKAANLISIQKEKKRAETNEKWLATCMKCMGDGLIITDPEGSVTYLNPVAETLTGWSMKDACEKPITEVFNIINEDSRKPVESPVEKVIREKKVVGLANHTILIAKGNEREYAISDSGAPILDEGEEILGVVLVFHDVSKTRELEREIASTKRYLENVVDSMPSVLVGVNPECNVTQWNLEAQKNTGISQAEALGRPLSEVMPEFSLGVNKVKEAISKKEARKIMKMPLKINGDKHFSDVMVYPLVTNGIEGAVVRIDDVTDKVRLEEMMIQTEKMLSVGGLAAGMAHEINNPLGGIIQGTQNVIRRLSPEIQGNSEVAEECGTTLTNIRAYMEKRKILKFLEGIRESGNRAAKIISNMLHFSRKSESNMAPHSLSRLIDSTIELAASDYDLKKKYDFKHIEIERDYDEGLEQVPCIETEMEQVILNFLKNSAHAISEKKDPEMKPKIIIRTRLEKEMARIEVEDNGCGIDAENCRRVFDPFFTTKEVGIGTGLGLSVAYFIITTNFNGNVEVESQKGEGTKFIMRIPLKRSQV
ncbi:PAS domain S-box protein [Candidatus Riflebacteria bacterium]